MQKSIRNTLFYHFNNNCLICQNNSKNSKYLLRDYSNRMKNASIEMTQNIELSSYIYI